jgi:hypothetical protein
MLLRVIGCNPLIVIFLLPSLQANVARTINLQMTKVFGLVMELQPFALQL